DNDSSMPCVMTGRLSVREEPRGYLAAATKSKQIRRRRSEPRFRRLSRPRPAVFGRAPAARVSLAAGLVGGALLMAPRSGRDPGRLRGVWTKSWTLPEPTPVGPG